MIPPSISKVKKAVITLEASLKNGTIYYISLMKDTISTLFVTSLHFCYTSVRKQNQLQSVFSKKEGARVADT